MKLAEAMASARNAITVRRVYADPYERDIVTVIPTAVVGRGAGGSGRDEKGPEGAGGGFGPSGTRLARAHAMIA